MRLTDLDPRWLPDSGGREAVALDCDCPCGCGSRMCVMIENPADGLGRPGTGAQSFWVRTGTDFDTLTLTPSILRSGGCVNKWHGFITNGEIVNA